jgi:hypothetical protein
VGVVASGRAAGRYLLALALVVYLFTAGGSLTTTDAVVMFDLAESIVTRQSVALSGNLLGMESQRGSDGRYYSPFGIGQSLFNIPFYAAGALARDVTGVRIGKPDTVPKAFVALGQAFVAAALVWLTFRLALAITGDVMSSALGALTLAFGSVLWPYARFGFNQPLACATLVAAVREAYLGVRASDNRRLAWSGAWLGASFLTRHEMIVGAAPLGLWLLHEGSTRGRAARSLLAFAPGVAAALAAWLGYNAWRFGNPFDMGLLRDPVPGLGSSLLHGLSGLVLSPTTSLFVYSPFALFAVIGFHALHRRDRSAAWLFAGIILTFACFYGSLGNWIGGRSYGSRYLLVVLPFLGVTWAAWLASWPIRRRLAWGLAVAALGAVVQLPGVLVDYAKVSQTVAAREGPFTTAERQWSWSASSLVLNARELGRLAPANVRYVLGQERPPDIRAAAGDDDRSFSQQLAFSLDFWWLYLFYLGALPRLAVFVVIGCASIMIVLCARGLAASVLRAGS